MKFKIGDVVVANGFPGVVYEANRSESPTGTVGVAVFGWGLDYGSVYVRDVRPSTRESALANVSDEYRDEFIKVADKYQKEQAKKEAAKERKAAKAV